jgi:hypothetical protein
MIRGMSRGALVFGPVLMALMLAVQPAAAATVKSTTGHVGDYAFQDDQNNTRGVDCVYETSKETHHGLKAYWLNKLSIRGPKVYARDNGGSSHQTVGWKYKIQTQPTSGGSAPWTTIYTSSVAKHSASIGSGYQFGRRTWNAPESFNDVNVRVLVIVNWYKRSDPSTVDGTVKATYDYYHVKGGGPDSIRQTDCYRVN